MEGAETVADALVREVWEETGHRLRATGVHVWNRSSEFVFRGETVRQHERYFLVRVDAFEPRGDLNPAANEANLLGEFRWWRIADIVASDEYFAPRKLGQLMLSLMTDGAPSAPLTVGW